ncbi:unnamed protein product [Meloidogyne enterolobii]
MQTTTRCSLYTFQRQRHRLLQRPRRIRQRKHQTRLKRQLILHPQLRLRPTTAPLPSKRHLEQRQSPRNNKSVAEVSTVQLALLLLASLSGSSLQFWSGSG